LEACAAKPAERLEAEIASVLMGSHLPLRSRLGYRCGLRSEGKMRLVGLSLLVGVGLFASLHAGMAQQANTGQCSALNNDSERLACYDKHLKQGVPGSAPTAENNNTIGNTAEGIGQWSQYNFKDQFTDQPGVLLSLDEDPDPTHSKSATLVIRCKNNRTELWVNWQQYLGSGQKVVIYRIDGRPSQQKTWGISTDRDSTFSSGAIPLIKELIAAKTFLVGVSGLNGSNIISSFTLDGIKEAIKPVQKTCNWS
jgi:type VI secretion system protein VasI